MSSINITLSKANSKISVYDVGKTALSRDNSLEEETIVENEHEWSQSLSPDCETSPPGEFIDDDYPIPSGVSQFTQKVVPVDNELDCQMSGTSASETSAHQNSKKFQNYRRYKRDKLNHLNLIKIHKLRKKFLTISYAYDIVAQKLKFDNSGKPSSTLLLLVKFYYNFSGDKLTKFDQLKDQLNSVEVDKFSHHLGSSVQDTKLLKALLDCISSVKNYLSLNL